MKRLFVFILAISMMLCLVACTENKQINTDDENRGMSISSEESNNETEQGVSVFDTENINRITFITRFGYGEERKVPDENMDEITAWLGTFTLAEIVQDDVPIAPGTNTIYVKIEYEDGTVINSGLDIANVDGVRYYTKHDPMPESYYEILSIPTFS